MTEEEQAKRKRRGRIGLVLAALLTLLVVLIVPPFISISRYKSQVSSLMTASLGRPVHLSAIHLKLLPRPGFVIDGLTVDEDPAYGAEPVLNANTVSVAIRLLSLWRGRLEISRISADEASVNIVRASDGRWNLDPLLQTTASRAGRNAAPAARLPYLAATNSRINFKNGAEKLPFSLINTDVSFWQANPGQWRIRLRGEPARTDVSLETGDTGIVELEGSVQRAADLHLMPMHLDLEWRDAQLGQLSRLLTGSDAGWRGDMRGEAHLDGTPEAAKISARLRAAGVHRADFGAVEPMDFDANCNLVYHYSQRAVEGLACDSPLGDGHIRIAGDVPGDGAASRYSVELDKVSAGAFLDALRTFRAGVNPTLQAKGSVSGKIAYAEPQVQPAAAKKPAAKPASLRGAKNAAPPKTPPSPLTGSLIIDGLQLSGGGLSSPIQVPKLVLEPGAVADGRSQTLTGSVDVQAGSATPLAVDVSLGLRGYRIDLRGQASVQRAKELAHAASLRQASALDALAGDPLTLDLTAAGPWLPPEDASPGAAQPGVSGTPHTDTVTGTVTLRNANWKADFLANHLLITDATLQLDADGARWDPVEFSYGPLKGSATLAVKNCAEPCAAPPVPEFTVTFADLNAATVQTTILGAHEKGTLLSDLLNRLHPSAAPAWPRLNGTVKAGTLAVGPVKLANASIDLRILPATVRIAALDGKLLGGTVHASGTLDAGDKPDYTLAGSFSNLNPTAVGQMLGQSWRGGTFNANGKLELAGYTGDDLASSAKGTLHFEWRRGAAAGPAPLARFDRWSGDAAIGGGKLVLSQSQVVRAGRKLPVSLSIPLEEPPRPIFAGAKQVAPAKKP